MNVPWNYVKKSELQMRVLKFAIYYNWKNIVRKTNFMAFVASNYLYMTK